MHSDGISPVPDQQCEGYESRLEKEEGGSVKMD